MANDNGQGGFQNFLSKNIGVIFTILGAFVAFYVTTKVQIAVIKEDQKKDNEKHEEKFDSLEKSYNDKLETYKAVYKSDMNRVEKKLESIDKKEDLVTQKLETIIADVNVIKYQLQENGRKRK